MGRQLSGRGAICSPPRGPEQAWQEAALVEVKLPEPIPEKRKPDLGPSGDCHLPAGWPWQWRRTYRLQLSPMK